MKQTKWLKETHGHILAAFEPLFCAGPRLNHPHSGNSSRLILRPAAVAGLYLRCVLRGDVRLWANPDDPCRLDPRHESHLDDNVRSSLPSGALSVPTMCSA